MKVIDTIKEMQKRTRELRSTGKSIGFVPTMGFLHEGHLELIKKAKEENDIVVLSIFVNPLQFGPNEDFDQYPRDIERDERLAKDTGVDFLFYPTTEEMYPTGYGIASLQVIDRVDVLCGKSREGHFDGVATVVMKLFNIVQPDHAYFGLKDAQQVAVIDGIVRDFNIPVKLRTVQTIREKDGLAKSSRNVYLTKSERFVANQLYESLVNAKTSIQNEERDPSIVKQQIINHIESQTNGLIDYVEILSYPELKELERLDGQIIIALAVKFSKARLIDNLIIELD